MKFKAIIKRIKESSITSQVIAGLIIAAVVGSVSFVLTYLNNSERPEIEKDFKAKNIQLSNGKQNLKEIPNTSRMTSKITKSERNINETSISELPQTRDDYEMRKKAINVFDHTFSFIRELVGRISKLKIYEDYIVSNTGYGMQENPLRKGHRYGLVNKYYSDIRYMPLNEVIVENYQYIFKLDGIEYYKISIMNEVDFRELEKIIEKQYTRYFEEKILSK